VEKWTPHSSFGARIFTRLPQQPRDFFSHFSSSATTLVGVAALSFYLCSYSLSCRQRAADHRSPAINLSILKAFCGGLALPMTLHAAVSRRLAGGASLQAVKRLSARTTSPACSSALFRLAVRKDDKTGHTLIQRLSFSSYPPHTIVGLPSLSPVSLSLE